MPRRLRAKSATEQQIAAASPVVELAHVSKRFDDTTVVSDLDLAIAPGQVFGLIGPSGCGKTTTIRLLLGVLAPTAGEVRVMGVQPTAFTTRHREKIGYTPQGFILYPTLTVIENARFVGGLFGLGWLKRRRRVREVLRFLELWDARHRMARDISGGMQRRLQLACALLHSPSLLFVDEPTAGLDPMLRAKIWEHLRDLRDGGTTVFVTTQHIDEAGYCDNVAILNKGEIAAVGSPDALRERAMGGQTVDVKAEELSRDDIASLRALPGVRAVQRTGDESVRATVQDIAMATPAITRALQRRGRDALAVLPYVATFEEVFIKIVNEHAPQPDAHV